MTLVGTLLGSGRGAGPRASLNGTHPLTSTALVEFLGGGRKATAGKRVTEENALEHSGVWRAVNLIAGTAAGLPLHAYERSAGRRSLLDEGNAAADLLADPHPDLTPFELWELAIGSLCTWGNAYFLKLRNPLGQVRELWWLHPGRVKAGRSSDGTKVYQLDGKSEPSEALGDVQILHIPGFGYDGVCGVSPIRLAREGIGLSLAAEEYGARLFGNGSLHTGFLQVEQRIDQEQADEVKALWKAGGTGLDSAHDIRVVGNNAKWVSLSIPPEDAQFLETRRFQIAEVARWFGLPPHMLAETDRSTSWGTGIEAQQIAMVVYTFGPWLTRIEQRLTKMFRQHRMPGTYAKYATAGLLRGDSAARAEFYRTMFELGVFSTNDIRALEDLDPVPGGDVRYRPLNLGILGEPDPVTAGDAGLNALSRAGRVLASAARRRELTAGDAGDQTTLDLEGVHGA